MKKINRLTPKQSDLLRKHDLAMYDLDGYDAFLETWQLLVDDNDIVGLPDQSKFADFELYASNAVHSFLETGRDLSGEHFGQHGCAAALVTATGFVRQINSYASHAENLTPGRYLSDCGVKFTGQENIEALLQHKGKDEPSTFRVVKSQNTHSNAARSLVISKIEAPNERKPIFLILFIVPPDVRSTATMMATKFNFTSIETEIAMAFFDGIALRDIATQRERSYVTVRNQFQRVLEKTGCTSQTELFRLSFSLSMLINSQPKEKRNSPRTVDKIMTLPRPNGRVVELVLHGDETGAPILNMHSIFGHGITPEIDALLQDNSVLLVSIMRPGFGGTSTPIKGQSLSDCVAADVRAILDSLEIDRCPCIARASAARPFYNLLTHLPNRISRGVVVNGMIPRKFNEGKSIISQWTNALMKASIVSYPIAKLILGTGHSLFMRSRDASFLKKMYQNSLTDCASFDDPEVVGSIRAGMRKVTQQGLDAGVQEMVNAFQNWSNELSGLQTPITLYHGAHDPHVPILGVRELAQDNAHCLSLREEPDGGGLLSHSHMQTLIDLALEN